MNIFIFTVNLFFIVKNILAQEYQIHNYNLNEYENNIVNNNNYGIKGKRDFAVEECSHINGLLGELNSFNCCDHEKITCKNNHIIE
eukprot:jgi/Orpsp1_1/1187960/evm.model.d7180000061483.1